MFKPDDLKDAVSAGIIGAEDAVKLEAFLSSRQSRQDDDGSGPGGDEGESLKFLTNFNDIFITIGIAILFTGLLPLIEIVFETVKHIGLNEHYGGVIVGLLFAAVAAGLMEYFCKRRRMLLPSMLLASVAVIAVTAGSAGAFISLIGEPKADFWDSLLPTGPVALMCFTTALITGLVIFARYRLPFSLFLAALAVTGMAYSSAAMLSNGGAIFNGGVSLLTGFATMLVAIGFDMRDPSRRSRLSDYAFWLHLAAAPQLIIGVNMLLTGSGSSSETNIDPNTVIESLTLLFVLIALAVIALAINRRALIASSLLTFIWTLSTVLDEIGMDGLFVFILVAVPVGTGVICLGAGWKSCRRAVLVLFPKNGIWSRIFPPELA